LGSDEERFSIFDREDFAEEEYNAEQSFVIYKKMTTTTHDTYLYDRFYSKLQCGSQAIQV